MNSFTRLSAQQLRHAAGIKTKLDSLQRQLVRILGTTAKSQIAKAARKRRKMSAAARAKIAAAQKTRWAKIKGTVKATTKAPLKKARKKISAEGIARIKAAQKARWAKFRAAKGG